MAVTAQVPIVPIVFSSMSDFYSRSELRWDAGECPCLRLRMVGMSAGPDARAAISSSLYHCDRRGKCIKSARVR